MAGILIMFYVVTALDVLIAAGFAIAGIVRPEFVAPGPQTESSRNFALNAAVRAIPLAIVTLMAIGVGAITAVEWLGTLAGIVQLGDAWIGWRQHDRGKTIGPLVIAILQFLVIILLRQSAAG
jgi:hypothetical protein